MLLAACALQNQRESGVSRLIAVGGRGEGGAQLKVIMIIELEITIINRIGKCNHGLKIVITAAAFGN